MRPASLSKFIHHCNNIKGHANGRNKCEQLPTLLGVVGQQCCVRLHGPLGIRLLIGSICKSEKWMHHEVCAVKVSGSKQNTFIVWLQVFAISLFLSIANFTKLQNKTTKKKKEENIGDWKYESADLPNQSICLVPHRNGLVTPLHDTCGTFG